MRRLTASFVAVLILAASAIAQQTALTEGQIKSAEIEVPRLMQIMELRPGMAVADVGAGFSAWTTRFARALGPTGRVYATEIGVPQLAALRENVAKEGLKNVTVIEGTTTATGLPPACCDAVLIRDAFHHFTAPAEMIASVAAALKPGGRLVVIDFPPRANSQVPAGVPANRLGHGVPAEVVEKEVGAALKHVRTMPAWAPESQPGDLYLVLFRKP
jgi:ubiquinone/menaquinone biosynthesis C-methylase UbiE